MKKISPNTLILAAVFIGVGAACTYLYLKKQEEKKLVSVTPGAATTDNA